MEDHFLGEDFIASVIAAGASARIETLQAGIPVFYRDLKRNLDLMEQPNGRRFEIRYIPGAPGDRNYEIIRELDHSSD